MRLAHWTFALLGLIPTGQAVAQQEPLTIYVRTSTLAGAPDRRQRVDPRPQAELEKLLAAAQDSLRALDKALRKAHGGKTKEWPADATRQLAEQSRQFSRAWVEAFHAEVTPADVANIEKDLAEAIAKEEKSGVLRSAKSVAEADIVIDVRGVRSQKTVPRYFKDNDCHELLVLQPGERAGAAAWLAALPADWGYESLTNTTRILTAPSAAATVLLDATSGAGNIVRCWGKATDAAIGALKQLRSALPARTGS